MAGHKQNILIGISLFSDLRSHLWGMVNHFAQIEAIAQGIELISRSANDSLDLQMNQIQELLAFDIDALIIAAKATDAPNLISMIQIIIDMGIPVIAMDSEIGEGICTCTVSANNMHFQQAVTTYLLDQLGGHGKIAHLQGDPHIRSSQLRTNGLHNILAQYPNIDLVFEEHGNFHYQRAYKIMSDYLQTQPELDAIIAANDLSAEGIIDALEEVHYPKQVLISGFDGHHKALIAIRQGKMAVTIKYDAHQLIRLSIEMAMRARKGESIPRQKFMGIHLITPENVDDEIAKYLEVFPYFVNDLTVMNTQLQREIEERKQAQITLKEYATALEHSNQELERSNQSLENFAYIASHDLHEPLRKIQIFGNRLYTKYRDVLDARGLDYLARMQSSSARMQLFIDDLLSYSRLSTTKPHFQMTNLNEVLQNTLEDLSLRIQENDAEIISDPLPTLEANPTQMGHLLQNLLSNAIKFQQKSVKPIIHITTTPAQNQSVQIEVADNGIGFDSEHTELIFGMFQRLHGRSSYQGTGIGLAICRKIVEQHQGTLTATAVKGKGAVFTILLPMTQTR